jgi:hypothetical protein
MEKSVVLGLATGTKQVSTSLARLVCYYAELLASQGLLSTALEYIKLVPSDDSSPELAALRDRISHSEQGMFVLDIYQVHTLAPDKCIAILAFVTCTPSVSKQKLHFTKSVGLRSFFAFLA